MRRTILLSAACLLGLVASCSSPGGGAATADPTLPAKTSAAEKTSASAPRTNANGVELNERGHIPKALGEEGGVNDKPGGSEALTFAIDAIRVDPECNSGFSQPPANGHYIAIDMRVATSPGLPADFFVSFSASDFAVIGSDGITNSSVDGQGYSCLDPASMFTYDLLGPGQRYTGSIVIDAPITTGTLVFAPAAFGGPTGWEWQF